MNWNKLIAVLFSFACTLLSTGILLLSKEDPTLGYGALVFFVVSLSLLWISYILMEKKRVIHKNAWFIALAICITSTSLPAYWITKKISTARDAAYKTNFSNTRVTNFHDEILLTEKGNPIGIRLRYTVTTPRSGRYFPTPSVSDGKSRIGRFYPIVVSVDPSPRLDNKGASPTGYYQADVPYRVVADLQPGFLLFDQKTRDVCVDFANADEERLVKNATPQLWEINIDGTSFSRYYGQNIHYLKNHYNLKDFYDGVVKENIADCTF